jgi:hypothetical protein
MERDPDHPVLEQPWRYEIGALRYPVGLDGAEPYLDLDLHLDGVVRRLRFWLPQQLVIEDGFPGRHMTWQSSTFEVDAWTVSRCG